MNWRELTEAVESESRRLGVPLDDLDITFDGKSLHGVQVSLLREDYMRPLLGGEKTRKVTKPTIRLLG